MNKKIIKALRDGLARELKEFQLVDSYLEAGGFEDRFCMRSGPLVRADLSIIGSPTTDSFVVRVRCDCDLLGRKAEAMYKPKWSERCGSREYDFSDFPGSVEFDIGMLTHGRPSTYHFLAGGVADAPVSVQKLYSTGDGPAYRAQRVPAAIALVSDQVRGMVNPYLDALEQHAGLAVSGDTTS